MRPPYRSSSPGRRPATMPAPEPRPASTFATRRHSSPRATSPPQLPQPANPPPSPISNGVAATTEAPDTTAPGDVNDLRGSAPFTVDLLVAPAIAASSVESASAGFAKATDGDPASYWGSLGKTTQTIEWITLDAGSIHDIGEARISSRPAGALFPENLEIQVSDDNLSFTTVKTAIGLPATQGMLHTFGFPAA